MTILVLLSLATHRLTLLISQERGPYAVFKTLRKLIGIHEEEVQYEDHTGTTITVVDKQIDNEFAAMVNCEVCFSGWISFILTLLFSRKRNLILNWLAVWGLVCLIFSFKAE